MKVIDLTGKKVGRWPLLERAQNSPARGTMWLCECECGTRKIVNGIVLRGQKSLSCGCLKMEILIARSTKHGHATNGISPTYHTWAGMIARCSNPKNKRYKDYGGRGITVCDRWKSFENFLADMGEKPQGTSIDRIDYSKGYSPDNCRWATAKEQARNKTNVPLYEYDGIKRSAPEWAEVTGINIGTLKDRLYAGWTTERALTTPVRRV